MRIPGPKWGAGRPPLETPKSSLARQTWPNSSPLRGWSFGAVGEGRERVRARHNRRTSTASFGGFAPLPPKVPQRGKSADHARMRMVPRPKRLLRQRLRKSARKLLPRKRLGVPSLPSRGCAEGTLARPQRGNPKGGAALFGQSLPTFCWPESRGPARPERVEGKIRNLEKGKEGK